MKSSQKEKLSKTEKVIVHATSGIATEFLGCYCMAMYKLAGGPLAEPIFSLAKLAAFVAGYSVGLIGERSMRRSLLSRRKRK